MYFEHTLRPKGTQKITVKTNWLVLEKGFTVAFSLPQYSTTQICKWTKLSHFCTQPCCIPISFTIPFTMYCTTQGHTQICYLFCIRHFIYWKAVANHNVTPFMFLIGKVLLIIAPSPMKLLEGNAFSFAYLSHVTITHDALELTVRGSPSPAQP